jgi:Z1 domain
MSTFYSRLRTHRQDNDELAACIERVVNQLDEMRTTSDRPGMLLGKIQSGKTRGFLGVIARAFDRGYDVAIVLTKGTKTLSAQTVARITSDFADFVNDDEVAVFDIMKMPPRLTKSERARKIIIVAKKQAQNLSRLLILFEETYPDLRDRRTLLIDDEADLASVRFVKNKETEEVEQGRIAEKMDALRRVTKQIAFLQVTATPYALYLQPDEYETSEGQNFVFLPKRPAFTELLPIHSGYVGGSDFFGDFEDDDPRAYVYVEVPIEEQDILRHPDGRSARDDRLLAGNSLTQLRLAILTFLISVCVRRWQQKDTDERLKKYALIIHNDTRKQAHAWQIEVVEKLLDIFAKASKAKDPALLKQFKDSYLDVSRSVFADHGRMPSSDLTFEMMCEALESEEVVLIPVNSDTDVAALLDDKAELRLRTAFNVFVGGNILDRGITIPNMIGFYYGRNPRRMQADTVLQHSRMYGARDRRDLAVTRFYTSRPVYDRLRRIDELEVALREAFEKGAHDRGVAFISRDESNSVVPCAPNKLMLSDVIAVRPGGRLLPVGFQSRAKTHIQTTIERIDGIIGAEWFNTERPHQVTISTVNSLIDLLEQSLDITTIAWDWRGFRAAFEYFSKTSPIKDDVGSSWLLAVTDRSIIRIRDGGRFSNAPDTKQQRDIGESYARTLPMLMMFRMDGSKENGWGGYPFWWPVLVAPHDAAPVVYASIDAVESDE